MSLQELLPLEDMQQRLNQQFGKLVVVLFYAEWSQTSIKVRSNMLALLPLFGQFDNVVYLAVSAERCPDAFKLFSVEYVPTIIFTDPFRTVLRRFQTEDVAVVLDALAEESENYRVNFEKERRVWFMKVKNIIEESPIVLFMLGTPESHRQDDSTGKVVGLLRRYGVEYTHYNVGQDRKILQWVRYYSGFQDYPQLFVNGKFLGDLDICLELDQRGEFLSKIPKASLPANPEEKLQTLLKSHKAIVLTDKFMIDSKQEHLLRRKLQQPDAQISMYNLAVNRKLHEYVLSTFQKKLPLTFIQGILQSDQ